MPNADTFQEKTDIRWEYASVIGILLIWVSILSLKIGVGLIAGLAIFALTRFTRRGFGRLLQPHRLEYLYRHHRHAAAQHRAVPAG